MVPVPPGGTEVAATILFADVRGSTALAERLTPTEYSGLLRSFYEVATRVIHAHGGTVDKFLGDGVVALFLPQVAGVAHAREAIDAAHALLTALDRDADGRPLPPVGVGVHTGRVWLGPVPGPHGRSDVTALGDAVNVAAHLCSAAAAGQVVVSGRALRRAGGAAATAPVLLKRRRAPVAARICVPGQSCCCAPARDSNSFRYSPYPSASSLSTGMKRNAAELMQ